VCDAVTLLQRAVEWGTQVSEALRKAAAAAAAYAAASNQQATQANGTSSAQPAPSGSAVTAAVPVSAYCVIQAACAAAAELWGRLQQYIDLPAVRREVSSVASKLLQPLLSVLDNSSIPDSSQAAALQLLAALLRCIPSSVRPALSSIERLLQQLVLRTAASTAGSSLSTAGGSVKQQLLAQAAVCAALLPAVAGDAAAWSDAARKLMVSSHDVLGQLLMGLEGRPLDTQYRSYLATPGATQQQGQQQQSGEGGWLHSLPWQQHEHEQQQSTAQRHQAVPALLLASFGVSALQHLMQQPFAVAVPVPGYSLALLAARLLRFDAAAAVAAGAVPGSSTMYQELLIMQPQLQLAGWQLLHHVVARCGQQLQLQGLLLRVVRQGLRSVQLAGPAALRQQPAAVRCRMYDTAVLLLQATGLAGARAVAAEAMGCVVLELYGRTAAASATARGATGGQQRPAKRARKSGGASGGELGQFDPAAAVAAAGADEGSRLAASTAADLQAQAGVLAVLKGLLGAGGQLLPAEVRAHADAVAYHISASAAQLAVQLGQQPGLSAAAAAAGGALSALRVAALEALLVSLLVPCSHRPPFLSQAVVLFRQGRSSSDAAVAAVCQSAAVQVEVLLHPRAAAMGGVRQYAGMDGVPALTKPRMWDVFAAEGPAAAGPAGSPAAAAGGAQAAAPAGVAGSGGGAGVAGMNGVERGQSGLLTSPSAAAGGSSLAAAAGSGVVMGFPVTGGNTAAQNQQGQGQQQQQQQQQPAVQPPQQHTAVEMQPVQRQNGGTSADDAAVHVQSGAAAQQAQVQPAVQQQQEQQVLQSNAQWAPVVQQQHALAAPAVAAARGTKATAAPVFENESSDSEGPLPDIDSGDSSSEDEMES